MVKRINSSDTLSSNLHACRGMYRPTLTNTYFEIPALSWMGQTEFKAWAITPRPFYNQPINLKQNKELRRKAGKVALKSCGGRENTQGNTTTAELQEIP